MAINQLKAGAFLSYVSIGLNNIVGLLYTPFMLRMMGQSEYGLYSLCRFGGSLFDRFGFRFWKML